MRQLFDGALQSADTDQMVDLRWRSAEHAADFFGAPHEIGVFRFWLTVGCFFHFAFQSARELVIASRRVMPRLRSLSLMAFNRPLRISLRKV